MKHSQICEAAMNAAFSAFYASHVPIPIRPGSVSGESFMAAARPHLPTLYDYARQRGFPPAETLARKMAELQAVPFAYASIGDMPADQIAFFRTFRAVADTLEPIYEADPAMGWEGGALWREPQPIDHDDIEQTEAQLGRSLMAAIEAHSGEGMVLHGWTPAEDPAEVVGDLVERVEEERQGRAQAEAELAELQALLKTGSNADLMAAAGAGVTAVEPDPDIDPETGDEADPAPTKNKTKKK